jgi:hypothetical protein
VCAVVACGSDPVSGNPVCGEEPEVMIGETVEGRLQPGDRRFDGSFVDYYSVRLNSPGGISLTLSSTEMDPLVLLFDENGDVAAQAFDSAGTGPGQLETARLVRAVSAGCHLVGASSWTRDTTGAYTLEVDATGAGNAATIRP